MTLLEKFIIARWCYAIGEDYLSDKEYEYVKSKLEIEMPGDERITRSWSDDPCPIALLKKHNLMKYYRDIKFAHKSESIRSIISEMEYESQFRHLSESTRLSYKIDGFNIQVNYYNGEPISAETRGRSGNSLNANIVVQLVPKKIPVKGKVKVTGELSIPKDKWKHYQLMTGNTSQRNSVSTALARSDVDYLSFLAFNIQTESGTIEGDLYKVLQNFGFKTPLCMRVENFGQLDKGINLMGKRNKAYNYLTDGVVVETSSLQVAVRIREWKEDVLKSYITGYTENPGIYGYAMVVDVKPVTVDGIRRSKVNVTNLQYIMDNNLQTGYPIAFNVRSAANCVLNAVMTAELQDEYHGRYEEYRAGIDNQIEREYI